MAQAEYNGEFHYDNDAVHVEQRQAFDDASLNDEPDYILDMFETVEEFDMDLNNKLCYPQKGDALKLCTTLEYTKFKFCFLKIPNLYNVGSHGDWIMPPACHFDARVNKNIVAQLTSFLPIGYFLNRARWDSIEMYLDKTSGNKVFDYNNWTMKIFDQNIKVEWPYKGNVACEKDWSLKKLQTFFYRPRNELFGIKIPEEDGVRKFTRYFAFVDFCDNILKPKLLHMCKIVSPIHGFHTYALLVQLPTCHKAEYVEYIKNNLPAEFMFENGSGCPIKKMSAFTTEETFEDHGIFWDLKNKFLMFFHKLLVWRVKPPSLLQIMCDDITDQVCNNIVTSSPVFYQFFSNPNNTLNLLKISEPVVMRRNIGETIELLKNELKRRIDSLQLPAKLKHMLRSTQASETLVNKCFYKIILSCCADLLKLVGKEVFFMGHVNTIKNTP